jgi:hypothetical protein
MKTRTGSLIVLLLILSHSGLGEQLKSDRVISVTSLKRYENDKNKGYKVEGKTSEPPVYYRLECGIDAAELQVGRSYKVVLAIAPDGWTRIMVFFDIHPDPKAIGMSCDIESEKSAARE